MLEKIAKVLINHNLEFSEDDLLCIKSQFDKCVIDFYFVCPEHLKYSHDLSNFQEILVTWDVKQCFKIIFLEDYYFKSINNYSELLCSEDFYSKFSNLYDYIFILQPDVWITDNAIIKNLLIEIRECSVDFVGAPLFFVHDSNSILNEFFKWNQYRLILMRIVLKLCKYRFFAKSFLINYFFLGVNGGASIRRIEPFLNFSKGLNRAKLIEYWANHTTTLNHTKLNGYFNEDVFWSLIVGAKLKKIKVAKNSFCAKYFWELGDKEILLSFVAPRKLPLAMHKFYKSYL